MQEAFSSLWRLPNGNGLEFLKAAYTDHTFPRHFHDTYVIEIVEEGVNECYCNGANYSAPTGHFLIINPGEVHTGNSWGAALLRYRCIYPSREFIHSILEREGELFFSHPVVNDPKLAANFLHMHRLAEKKEECLDAETLLIETLVRLFETHSNRRPAAATVGSENLAIRNAKEYIHDNYQKQILLHDLASLSRLSPFHFLRAFRKHTGMPPVEYLRNVRVDHARRLLRKGHSITETAMETGFFDQSHLTRHFKRFYGITPGQYRAIPSKTSAAPTS